MTTTTIPLLIACALCALTGAAYGQDAPREPDTTWHAPDPPVESADESAPAEGEEVDDAATDAGDDEASDDGETTDDADASDDDEEREARGADEEFVPSEKIRADSALSFPVDI
jgi:hypothetical protein